MKCSNLLITYSFIKKVYFTALAPASRQSCVEIDAGRQASLSHFPALGRRARFMFSPSSDWCILSARVVIGHAEKHALFSTNRR